jgi:hypothetical protein
MPVGVGVVSETPTSTNKVGVMMHISNSNYVGDISKRIKV